jgi:glycosyltransferase involved in cell wall biosynthesis
MACGLPVIVSNRCGCASDLVAEGTNGFTFDPTDIPQLGKLMLKVAAADFPRIESAEASRRIIAGFGPDAFAAGLAGAAEAALEFGSVRPSWCDLLLLHLLCQVR